MQMKKKIGKLRPLLSAIFFIVISSTAFAMTYGDVNNDYYITIIDALFTAQHTAGMQPAAFDPNAADVNGDNTVTIIDALLIARYSARIITQFPIPTPTPKLTPTPSCELIRVQVIGKITDRNGQPVSGATISSSNSLVTATTDEAGDYSLEMYGYRGAPICIASPDGFLTAKAPGYLPNESAPFPLNTSALLKIDLVLLPLAPVTPTPVP
jgi:hypothetical protein